MTDGDARNELRIGLGISHHRSIEFSSKWPRADCVHSNTFTCELECQSLIRRALDELAFEEERALAGG